MFSVFVIHVLLFAICVLLIKMGDLEKCSDFPDHVAEELLTLLPVESLCRFRNVYKEWNALFTSSEFIITKWEKKSSNGNRWMVVQNPVSFSASRFFNGGLSKKVLGYHSFHFCESASSG